MEEQKETAPKWLTEIQNNSWNPELIISGFSLVLIFNVSSYADQFIVSLLQTTSFSLEFVQMVGLYIGIMFATLKVMLSLHLILRGVWTGLVGITYVFPQGIKFEKLSQRLTYSQIKNYHTKPTEAIMRVERICSSIFSITFSIVGVNVQLSIYFALILLLEDYGVPMVYPLVAIYVYLGLLFLLPVLNRRRLKKRNQPLRIFIVLQRFLKTVSFFYIKETTYLFVTNSRRGVAWVMMLLVMAPLAFLGLNEISYTYQLGKELSKRVAPSFATATVTPQHYADQAEPKVRLMKARIDQFVTSRELLEVDVAQYAWDEKSFEQLYGDSVAFRPDSLLRFSIDDAPAVPMMVYPAQLPFMKQKTWKVLLATDSLALGPHTLQIEKIDWDTETKDTLLDAYWIAIPFVKE
ncbi:MAG TPA: hypothetical protein DCE41_12845 [Cytophagales bacterium]|nr:hypothetical protein [Cytophagales bacterium]HAA21530.1 hypothetical protein [Cytophagales bacterium]HAP64058.1 hypothetical protein [Cytophagales bacterium]